MLRTAQFACTLPKADADAVKAESGRVYTDMLVRHYRLYRKQGICLAQKLGERLEDALFGPTRLACSQPRCRRARASTRPAKGREQALTLDWT